MHMKIKIDLKSTTTARFTCRLHKLFTSLSPCSSFQVHVRMGSIEWRGTTGLIEKASKTIPSVLKARIRQPSHAEVLLPTGHQAANSCSPACAVCPDERDDSNIALTLQIIMQSPHAGTDEHGMQQRGTHTLPRYWFCVPMRSSTGSSSSRLIVTSPVSHKHSFTSSLVPHRSSCIARMLASSSTQETDAHLTKVLVLCTHEVEQR
jgi:hypothetical protein